MHNKKNTTIVVGAGPSGIFQALYLAKVKQHQVILIEQQDCIGGFFNSIQTPYGTVDTGVFILEETGNTALDELIFNCLPENEWNVLENTQKDIAGNYFEGKLNTDTIYPDLRALEQKDYLECLGDLFSSLQADYSQLSDNDSLEKYFEQRFGSVTTEKILKPLAQKIWQQPLENLSLWAAKLVHLNRLVTHNHDTTVELKSSAILDDILAFPEQLKVPGNYLKNKTRSLYPKKYGLTSIVNNVRQMLLDLDVRILTSTTIKKLNTTNNKLISISAEIKGVAEEIKLDHLLWTIPSNFLNDHFNLKSTELIDKPIPHRVIYLFLDVPPLTGELYWFWSYDPNNSFVRVSSPHAFCPSIADAKSFPLCIETHIVDPELADEELFKLIEEEVRTAGLVSDKTIIKGYWVAPKVKGFFVPTLTNCNQVAENINRINELKPNNLILSAQNISDGTFYLRDVLKNAIDTIDKFTINEVIQTND
jgi:oxygen-dependent protoporphyrinogen oxidase